MSFRHVCRRVSYLSGWQPLCGNGVLTFCPSRCVSGAGSRGYNGEDVAIGMIDECEQLCFPRRPNLSNAPAAPVVERDVHVRQTVGETRWSDSPANHRIPCRRAAVVSGVIVDPQIAPFEPELQPQRAALPLPATTCRPVQSSRFRYSSTLTGRKPCRQALTA